MCPFSKVEDNSIKFKQALPLPLQVSSLQLYQIVNLMKIINLGTFSSLMEIDLGNAC